MISRQAVLLRSVLTTLAAFFCLVLHAAHPAFAQNTCQSGSAFAAPANLRVDIPTGSTGKLFVSWNTVSGANYYNVCRSTDNTNWKSVNYCSGKNPLYKSLTSGVMLTCRDDNVGTIPAPTAGTLVPSTPYYYEVQACNSAGACGAFTTGNVINQNYNVPIQSDCTLTSMQNLKPTKAAGIPTSAIIGTRDPFHPYPPDSDANEFYGYYNSTANPNGSKETLLVHLPGSGGTCGGSEFLSVAQNLGFDAICVNYDNHSEQENICNDVNATGDPNYTTAACFDNISQAKLDFTGGPSGTCTAAGDVHCGNDQYNNSGKTGTNYYILSKWDTVRYRITSMLYYLWCNGYDNGTSTQWENYLSLPQGATCANTDPATVLPNWSKIIMSGWSQGGNMSTFTAQRNPVQRVVNLSAPLAGVNVGTAKTGYTMVPACYYWGFNTDPSRTIFPSACANVSQDQGSATPIRQIYGLASSNDDNRGGNQTVHYTPPPPYTPQGVLQTVWNAMGYNYAPNDDVELDLNCNNPSDPFPFCSPNTPALNCSGNGSHNLVNHALYNKAGNGHADTLFLWNEDMWQFMLTQ